MIKTQKIMSPVFPAAECALRLSVYATAVTGQEYLSMCLESKDTEKGASAGGAPERSCWCLFRMSVLPSGEGGMGGATAKPAVHRDSYGRFAADTKSGDNTSLGWNDFQLMSSFLDPASGFLCGDTATFSVVFHVLREAAAFTRALPPAGRNAGKKAERAGGGGGGGQLVSSSASGGSAKGEPEVFQGKFVWRIEHFTKLKELLKKRKITGLCVKSRRFQVGGRDLRLIIYPRGQSQPPQHLSMFLEVTHPRAAAAEWSCFVSHRLAVVCQTQPGDKDKTVAKESQNRYSRTAKDWGWREFISLTHLFDVEAGFLVSDCVVFSADVLILKESSELRIAAPASELATLPPGGAPTQPCVRGAVASFAWRVENFGAFKEIMETRKIFSKYFTAGGCELRIGVYESFDTLCIYLESEPPGAETSRNFWVRYRIAVVHQRNPERTSWRESSICTRTWNNSVLQFMKASEMVEPDAGLVARDTAVFACEVLECCPWFEFGDVEIGSPQVDKPAPLPGAAVPADGAPEALGSTQRRGTASEAAADGGCLADGGDGGEQAPNAVHDEVTAPLLAAAQTESATTTTVVAEQPAAGDACDGAAFRAAAARLGAHLTVREEGPPIVPSPPALLAAARAQLEAPAASAAFLAALRGYLADPARARRLLLPVSAGGKPGAASRAAAESAEAGAGSSLAALLLEVPSLRLGVQEALLDALVFILCRPQQLEHAAAAAAAAACAASAADATVVAVSHQATTTAGRAAAAASSGDDAALAPLAAAWAHAAPELSALLVAALGAEGCGAAGGPGGAASAAGAETQPPPPPPPPPPPQQHPSAAPPAPARRSRCAAAVSSLLRHAAGEQVAGLCALAPRVVPPAEHAHLAQPLLSAARAPGVSPRQRMAALAALSTLQLDAPQAEAALQEALTVLPLLHEAAHLTLVVAFALRGATPASLRGGVLQAVRARARPQQGQTACDPATTEAARGIAEAAVMAAQARPELAVSVVATVEAAWGGGGAAAPSISQQRQQQQPAAAGGAKGKAAVKAAAAAAARSLSGDGNGPAVTLCAAPELAECEVDEAEQLSWTAEVSVLADCVAGGNSSLVSAPDACALLSRGVARGAVGARTLALALRAGGRAPRASAAAAAQLGEVLARSSAARCRGVARELYGAMAEWLAHSQATACDGGAVTADADASSPPAPLELLLQGLATRCVAGGGGEVESFALDVLSDACTRCDEAPAQVLSLLLRCGARSAAESAAAGARAREAEAARAAGARSAVADEASALRKERAAAAARAQASDAALARLRGEAEAAGERAARERREVADKLRAAEAQLSWAASERLEASELLVRERDGALARAKESDLALQRSKAAAKEDAKRVQRDKAALLERATRAEGALADALAASQRAASLPQRLPSPAPVPTVEDAHSRAATVAYLSSIEAKLRASEEYIATLERSLAEEVSRHAPLYGSGIHALSEEQLHTLSTIHEEGLRTVRQLMLARQHEHAAAAAAAAAAVAAAVVDDGELVLGRSSSGSGGVSGATYLPLGGLGGSLSASPLWATAPGALASTQWY